MGNIGKIAEEYTAPNNYINRETGEKVILIIVAMDSETKEYMAVYAGKVGPVSMKLTEFAEQYRREDA